MNILNELQLPQTTRVAICFPDGNSYNCGDVSTNIKFHSAAKPIQMIHFLRENYQNSFGFTESERVIFAASHFGQDIHIAALESIIAKATIDVNELIVSACEPLGVLAKDYWRKKQIPQSKLFHQCSGQHIGFMIRQKELGADSKLYFNLDSPVQIEALSNVRAFVGNKVDTALDNCGVPTYEVSLSQIACAYMNLVAGEPFAVGMLRRHPIYVEGDGSLAIELMNRHLVLAKTSTNLVVAISHLPLMAGIAIQSENWTELAYSATSIIKRLGYLL